ncbi:MAG: type II toxin-antitoxin system VapC family toxin [Acidobacteriota bacterium]|nr:type II toxin-antitoxin system VapC family toxin [Acidobacteriota bacterium]
MKVAYFDSSAIVKLERLEPESLALVDYLAADDIEASTSIVAGVEVSRALKRVRATAAPSAEPMRGFFLLELDPAICAEAGTLESPALRSLDAIHLATALAINDDLDFITYDDRLAAAAREHGLRVVQPGRT